MRARCQSTTNSLLDLTGSVLTGEQQHVDHLPRGLRDAISLGDLLPQLVEDRGPAAALAFLGKSERPSQRAQLACEQLQVMVE